MDSDQIIAEMDSEIARLTQASNLLAGRDSRSYNTVIPINKPRKKRRLSADARARIAAAQRKRWAAQKKAAKAA